MQINITDDYPAYYILSNVEGEVNNDQVKILDNYYVIEFDDTYTIKTTITIKL